MNEMEIPPAFIRAAGIRKTFQLGKTPVDVLKGVDFIAERGEWVALLGASGSGKTTLLDILGTISKPDGGTLSVDSVEIGRLSNRDAVAFRRKKIGFVFQAYHMLPELSILENVMLPAMLDGRNILSIRERAKQLLENVGLADRIKHRPNELSGGEQQRGAIARALINSPLLILADEPTGNLDSVTGGGILEIFHSIHREGTTIVMVTHDRDVAKMAGRTVELKDGKISSEPNLSMGQS